MHKYITEMEYAEVPRIQDVIRIRWQIPIVAVAIYALVIFGGRRVMRDREPFDLKNALAVWNGLLAAFSIVGMIRTVPYLFFWYVRVCQKNWRGGGLLFRWIRAYHRWTDAPLTINDR